MLGTCGGTLNVVRGHVAEYGILPKTQETYVDHVLVFDGRRSLKGTCRSRQPVEAKQHFDVDLGSLWTSFRFQN
jgi:hypothetical protein